MCMEIKKFAKEKTNIIIFSVFLICCWGAALVYQHRAASIMRKDMNSILERYDKILDIEKIQNGIVDEADVKLLCDDLHLTQAQRLSLQTFVNNTLNHAVELSRVDLERNAIVAAKADAMFNETRDILDSQFLKIQHETESLQIWCALITVVFLVFSFFSLFQSGEFVRKGEEGVAELKNLKSQAENTVQILQQRSDEALNQFSDKNNRIGEQIQADANEIRAKMQKSLDDANILMQTMTQEVSKAKESSSDLSKKLLEQAELTKTQLTTIVNEEKARMEEKEKKMDESLEAWMNQKEEDIDLRSQELLGNLKLVGSTLESQFDAMNNRLGMLEEDVKSLKEKEA